MFSCPIDTVGGGENRRTIDPLYQAGRLHGESASTGCLLLQMKNSIVGAGQSLSDQGVFTQAGPIAHIAAPALVGQSWRRSRGACLSIRAAPRPEDQLSF